MACAHRLEFVVIVTCVVWYPRFSRSVRDVEEPIARVTNRFHATSFSNSVLELTTVTRSRSVAAGRIIRHSRGALPVASVVRGAASTVVRHSRGVIAVQGLWTPKFFTASSGRFLAFPRQSRGAPFGILGANKSYMFQVPKTSSSGVELADF